jgi:hypothetical protein
MMTPSLGTFRWTLTGLGAGTGASAIRAPRSLARSSAGTGDGRVLARAPSRMTWRRCPSNQSVTLARAGSGPTLTLHPARSAIVGVHGAADLDHVLAEHQVQVAVTEDQGPVQQLAAQGSNDALASGVHPRRPRQGGDDPQSFGLEPHRAEAVIQVHGEVAGLLHHPCRGRSCGYPGQVQPPGAVLDEHQHVQPLQQHRFHHQEVARDDRVGPGCQELPPGRPSYSSFTT